MPFLPWMRPVVSPWVGSPVCLDRIDVTPWRVAHVDHGATSQRSAEQTDAYVALRSSADQRAGASGVAEAVAGREVAEGQKRSRGTMAAGRPRSLRKAT